MCESSVALGVLGPYHIPFAVTDVDALKYKAPDLLLFQTDLSIMPDKCELLWASAPVGNCPAGA